LVTRAGITRIIFLVHFPLSSHDQEKWGFEYLRSEGYTVEVYDLSPFLTPASLECSRDNREADRNLIRKITSYEDFERRVSSVASSAVFIDYIMGFADPDLKTEKLFRVLGRYRAKYFLISAGALPVTRGRAKRLFTKIKTALNPKKLASYAVRKIIAFLKRNTALYASPERIFCGNSEVADAYLRRFKVASERVTSIHSLDYDTFLHYIRKTSPAERTIERTCVFLDENACHNVDFAILNLRPLTPEKYFPSMARLFDVIEKKTGLKVVIAAHPRSHYEQMSGIYGEREIIKGKTVELVAKSSLVLLHGSTAVSFAVLFNKPAVIIKTEEMMKNSHFSTAMDAMKTALGAKTINIDDPSELNGTSFDYANWPRDNYDEYKYKYVKSPDAEELTTWEFVAREIQKMNSEKQRLSF